jgi:hypothetical protein
VEHPTFSYFTLSPPLAEVEHPEEAEGGAAAAAAAAGGAAWDHSEAAGAASGAGGVGGAKEDGGAEGRGGRRAAVGVCEGVLAPEGGGGRPGCVADIVQVSSRAAPRALLRPPRVAAGDRPGRALGQIPLALRLLHVQGDPPPPADAMGAHRADPGADEFVEVDGPARLQLVGGRGAEVGGRGADARPAEAELRAIVPPLHGQGGACGA